MLHLHRLCWEELCYIHAAVIRTLTKLLHIYVNTDAVTSLFLQVVGGKMTESGRLCAFITKVRKGSLADTVGHLRPGIQQHTKTLIQNWISGFKRIQHKSEQCIFSTLRTVTDSATMNDQEIKIFHVFWDLSGVFAGDQVLEWNGKLLQGATFKEVYNIILESKPEPQVELVVSRPIGWELTVSVTHYVPQTRLLLGCFHRTHNTV